MKLLIFTEQMNSSAVFSAVIQRLHGLTLPQSLNVPVCFYSSWKSVADYIDQQFEQYFRDESGLNRKNIQDNRVHCCLYFISPFGHGYDKVAVLL